jgi:hypothetical protein
VRTAHEAVTDNSYTKFFHKFNWLRRIENRFAFGEASLNARLMERGLRRVPGRGEE